MKKNASITTTVITRISLTEEEIIEAIKKIYCKKYNPKDCQVDFDIGEILRGATIVIKKETHREKGIPS
jgi:hypothetical protein